MTTHGIMSKRLKNEFEEVPTKDNLNTDKNKNNKELKHFKYI